MAKGFWKCDQCGKYEKSNSETAPYGWLTVKRTNNYDREICSLGCLEAYGRTHK